MVKPYHEFIRNKSQWVHESGFKVDSLPDFLFPFQHHLVEWALLKGRSAIFADCGMGKTAMQLAWANEIVKRTNGRVLIATPLAVANQTVQESAKFGIDASQSRDGRLLGKIVVTNYERLHNFDPSDFVGLVCDESSILKSFSGATRKLITRFVSKMPYRLLCTATAAPNDYIELGTSSEALGNLSYSEMLKMFFRQLDDKGQKLEQKNQEQAERLIASDPNYFKKLAFRVSQTIGQWRLKHHAITDFWRWVASWAKACRKPSDLGFTDAGYDLPQLITNDHVIEPESPADGFLFTMPAIGMGEERAERKRTLEQRCGYAADLVSHNRSAVIWCHSNAEGDTLEDTIDDAKQVSGSMSEEEKIEVYDAFAAGQLRVLVIKPKIGAWGLNWQFCNHVVTFPSHSYEQYYQSVRRCWRFGQTQPVTLDVIATEGEIRVLGNMRRKAEKADEMFARLVENMNNTNKIESVNHYSQKERIPQWL